MRQPLIASTLVKSTARLKAGTYDSARQLTLDEHGVPLLMERPWSRPETRTYVEAESTDPAEPRPPKPRTVTRVTQEPADVAGFARPRPPETLTKQVVPDPADVAGFSRPRPSTHSGHSQPMVDYWGDDPATGTVAF